MRIRICRRFASSSFITTPIFYANGAPHLGHLYTAVLADASHRWHTLKEPGGSHVLTTGTDEHGSKIAQTARGRGIPVRTLCDEVSNSFRTLFGDFDIRHTTFVRTTEERHRMCVENMWHRLDRTGCITKGSYSGWYSTTDECFYQESDVEEAGEGRIAKETRSRVEWHEEENYMFDLGRFREPIRRWLTSKDVIRPRHYLPLALRQIESESQLSISRDRSRLEWGIPVPGDDRQTIYVWLDALCNYLTVAGYPEADPPSPWPPTTQIMGKDIVKFHAFYWPAFLLAAGLPLPERLFIHGHWTVDGAKMSKSVGNIVDPREIGDKVTKEGLRYFLLKNGLPHDDSNFSVLKAMFAINADLVNNVANLVVRATAPKMNPSQLYPFSDILEQNEIAATARPLIEEMSNLRARIEPLYNQMLFYKAIEELMAFSKSTNAFFQLHAPWKMKQGAALSTVLYITYESSRILSVLLQPLTPTLAEFCLNRLGVPKSGRGIDTATYGGGSHLDLTGTPLGDDSGMYMERLEIPPELTAPQGKANNKEKAKRKLK